MSTILLLIALAVIVLLVISLGLSGLINGVRDGFGKAKNWWEDNGGEFKLPELKKILSNDNNDEKFMN